MIPRLYVAFKFDPPLFGLSAGTILEHLWQHWWPAVPRIGETVRLYVDLPEDRVAQVEGTVDGVVWTEEYVWVGVSHVTDAGDD